MWQMRSALSKMNEKHNPFWNSLSDPEKDIVAFYDVTKPLQGYRLGKEEVLDVWGSHSHIQKN